MKSSRFFYVLSALAIALNIYIMTANEQFEKLLKVKWNFDEALALCQAYGENSILYKMLAGDSKSSFFNNKLRGELERIYEIRRKQVKVNVETMQGFPNEHPSLQQIIIERNKALKERDFLRGKLTEFDSDEKRKEAAFRILELDDIMSECWNKIDYFEIHGHLPAILPSDEIEKIFSGKDKADIVKLRNNYRSYRTKVKKGQRDASLMPHYEAVLQECERRLM